MFSGSAFYLGFEQKMKKLFQSFIFISDMNIHNNNNLN